MPTAINSPLPSPGMALLQLRYEEAEKFALQEGYVKELIIGTTDEFQKSDIEEFEGQILIHNGVIFYTGNLSDIHQAVAAMMGRVLEAKLNQHFGHVFECRPGSGKLFENQLGCHYRWRKIADQCVYPWLLRFPSQELSSQLLVPVEVSYLNETLFRLLIEGVGWTNSLQPNTHSCVLVKIYQDMTKGYLSMRIMVVAKEPPNSEAIKSNLRRTYLCSSGTLPNQRWSSDVPRETIEDTFKINLLFDQIFLAEMLDEIYFGPPQVILMHLRLFNPATLLVEDVQIDIYEFVRYCACKFLMERF